jgi:hypothetical protein
VGGFFLLGGFMNKLAQYVFNVAQASAHLVGAPLTLYKPRPTESYSLNVAISLDEFGNAITGGDPEETISSRAAKARNAGRVWGCVLCKFLGYVATKIAGKPTDHCTLSLAANEGANAVIPDGD